NRRRESGCILVLATASHASLADQVADHLGLFDDVLATDGTQNLKGSAKLARIQGYCQSRGETAFTYLGDSRADLPIWQAADEAIVVAPSGSIRRAVQASVKQSQVLVPARPIWRPVARAMRLQQWVKNLLVFVPLMLAHKLNDMAAILNAVVAFFA